MKTVVALGGSYDGEKRTADFIDFVAKRTGKKNQKVTILPTAKADIFDEENCSETGAFAERGCHSEVLKLSQFEAGNKRIEKTLLTSDIILVTGGNLRILMNEWKRTKTDLILREAYEKGIVLCGSSSGAMCWFSRGYDDCGSDGSFMFVDCLGILPYCFCPHFNNGKWPTFTEAVKQQKLDGLAAENGAMVACYDGTYKILKEGEEKNVYFFDSEKEFAKKRIAKNAGILNKIKTEV